MSERKENQDLEERRELRRQRRIRAQVTAYLIFAAILIVVVGGCFLGVKAIASKLGDMKAQQEEAIEQAQLEAQAAMETTIAPPEEETEEVTTEDDMLSQIVDTCIAEMPLEDKVAGLFFITPEQLTGVNAAVKAGSGTQEALTQYAYRELVYSSKHISSTDQISTMLSQTTSMSKYPIFLAVSEEGGDFNVVADALGTASCSNAQEIGTTGTSDVAYDAGITVSSYLNMYGFNLDFAPYCNLSDYSRSFNTDPTVAADMASAFSMALEDTGVSSCMKYFPIYADTDDGLETTDKTLEELREAEFVPFKVGIENGVDMIMISNASAPQVTGDNTPCSLSSVVINDVLRNELGYDGIIITGELGQSAISDYYTSSEAAVMAIKAGADMLYVPENFEEAYQGVLDAISNGEITEERINESLARIYRVKYADKIDS